MVDCLSHLDVSALDDVVSVSAMPDDDGDG
jgi:hypothetical protein